MGTKHTHNDIMQTIRSMTDRTKISSAAPIGPRSRRDSRDDLFYATPRAMTPDSNDPPLLGARSMDLLATPSADATGPYFRDPPSCAAPVVFNGGIWATSPETSRLVTTNVPIITPVNYDHVTDDDVGERASPESPVPENRVPGAPSGGICDGLAMPPPLPRPPPPPPSPQHHRPSPWRRVRAAKNVGAARIRGKREAATPVKAVLPRSGSSSDTMEWIWEGGGGRGHKSRADARHDRRLATGPSGPAPGSAMEVAPPALGSEDTNSTGSPSGGTSGGDYAFTSSSSGPDEGDEEGVDAQSRAPWLAMGASTTRAVTRGRLGVGQQRKLRDPGAHQQERGHGQNCSTLSPFPNRTLSHQFSSPYAASSLSIKDRIATVRARRLKSQNPRNHTPTYSCHYPRRTPTRRAQSFEDEKPPPILSSLRRPSRVRAGERGNGRGVPPASIPIISRSPRGPWLSRMAPSPFRRVSPAAATAAASAASDQRSAAVSRGVAPRVRPLAVAKNVGATSTDTTVRGAGRVPGGNGHRVFSTGWWRSVRQRMSWPMKFARGSRASSPAPSPHAVEGVSSSSSSSSPFPSLLPPSTLSPPSRSSSSIPQSPGATAAADAADKTPGRGLFRGGSLLGCISDGAVPDVLLSCTSPAGSISSPAGADPAFAEADLTRFSGNQSVPSGGKELIATVAKSPTYAVRCPPLASAEAVAASAAFAGGDGSFRRRKTPPTPGRGSRPHLSLHPRTTLTMKSTPTSRSYKIAKATGALSSNAVRRARRERALVGGDLYHPGDVMITCRSCSSTGTLSAREVGEGGQAPFRRRYGWDSAEIEAGSWCFPGVSPDGTGSGVMRLTYEGEGVVGQDLPVSPAE